VGLGSKEGERLCRASQKLEGLVQLEDHYHELFDPSWLALNKPTRLRSPM